MVYISAVENVIRGVSEERLREFTRQDETLFVVHDLCRNFFIFVDF